MTPNPRSRSSAWQLLHLCTRLLGVTGVHAIVVGVILWSILGLAVAGPFVVIAGVIAVAVAIIAELGNLSKAVFSSRGAVGFNSALQILLALVLLVGVNYFSFEKWHKRLDWTQDKIFTLPVEIRERLAQLRSDTDIIIYLEHVSFGQRVEIRQDRYDQAAEKKITEKVIDLKEQFEDLGKTFRIHVHVLDTQTEAYPDREAKLREVFEGKEQTSQDKERANELIDKIKKAPENSIFFYSRESKDLQRLSFNDIYHLDKKASVETKNLVLNYQGVEPFARKIFNIEEKTPRLTTAIIHPFLGTQNREAPMYTMNGAKKVLDSYGFVSSDLMLRKIEADGDLTEEPTALTYDESRYEQIEDELAELNESIPDLTKDLEKESAGLKFWTESTMEELNKKYLYYYLRDGRQGIAPRTEEDKLNKSKLLEKIVPVDDDDRRNSTNMHRQNVDVLKHVLESQIEEKKNLTKEKSGLKAENLAEKRRFSDLEAKMKSVFANVDLLVIPRMTLVNAPRGFRIPNRIHKLDVAQLNAVRAYLKEGKPALFLLGPTNDPNDAADKGRDLQTPDTVESMLAELGFKLPRQTILYNIEAKEFNERKVGITFSRQEIEVPGVKLDDTTETGLSSKVKEQFTPHAIRTSIKLMGRNIANKDGQEISIRHPRPVYYMRTSFPPADVSAMLGGLTLPGMNGSSHAIATYLHQAKQKVDDNAVFLVTREESWNENHPFIAKNKVPRYAPTPEDDPKKGTIEEARRGPFPIGVAVETNIPASWYDKDPKQQKARIAVIGSGNVFVGASLNPLKEKMLLDVVNWLIGRDDLLAKDSVTWSYPRLAMKPTSIEYQLWSWGAQVGLPLLFLYFGTAVFLIRRMR